MPSSSCTISALSRFCQTLTSRNARHPRQPMQLPLFRRARSRLFPLLCKSKGLQELPLPFAAIMAVLGCAGTCLFRPRPQGRVMHGAPFALVARQPACCLFFGALAAGAFLAGLCLAPRRRRNALITCPRNCPMALPLDASGPAFPAPACQGAPCLAFAFFSFSFITGPLLERPQSKKLPCISSSRNGARSGTHTSWGMPRWDFAIGFSIELFGTALGLSDGRCAHSLQRFRGLPRSSCHGSRFLSPSRLRTFRISEESRMQGRRQWRRTLPSHLCLARRRQGQSLKKECKKEGKEEVSVFMLTKRRNELMGILDNLMGKKEEPAREGLPLQCFDRRFGPCA